VRTSAPQFAGHGRRFLVAGGAGFIGSHLIARLLHDGHEVIAVDNFITGDWRNLAEFLHHDRFTFLAHDVVRPLNALPALDWILHFASPASPPKYQKYPVQTMRSNAEGTFHLLNLAHAHGAGFLLASTSEVYGDPAEHPQTEQYWGHVNPVGPRAVYDEGKRYAESMTTTYHENYGVPVRIIRIFNTYGPRMQHDDGRVVVNFIRQALANQPLTVYGDGTQTRSFQFIDDLVEGVLRVLEIDHCSPINLGNPVEHTVGELAQVVREVTRSRSMVEHRPLPTDDPRRRLPDISLARRLMDWQPRVSLREGLAAMVEHVRETMANGEPAARNVDPRPRHAVASAKAGSPASNGSRPHHETNGDGHVLAAAPGRKKRP